ncbi:MAG: heparan-alpha-glucosaminide N-acetyltransferase domain-containing protein [Prevotellaceae bacterium]|jgi:predicted acyltransferase|nr:heparan-alpha-glucosaminide N-acetyltransferase domain-containing protein [Prevotellaceae bacterium]
MTNRLKSLDILRGLTIAGMILVNNPGSWGAVYAPLRHASWHGLTPTDLVFPFFMFIMGVSMYLSLRKFDFAPAKQTFMKILKRTVIIFLIGLAVVWFSRSLRTFRQLSEEELGFFNRLLRAVTNVEGLRIMGVMQRLALSYGFAALVAVTVKHKFIPYIIGAVLAGYFLLLALGNGFELSETNILSVIDRAVLGASHLYTDAGVKLDPEGLASTIPAICHVLIGFCCGKALAVAKDNREKMLKLFITGACLTFAGFLLAYGCPVNKKIWSPTFVLLTCGLAATLLALLIWIVDEKGYKRWGVFFESFGVNPLFIYTQATVLAILLGNIVFPYDGHPVSVTGFMYQIVLQPLLGDYPGSLAFALLFVGVNWTVGNILYKKQIYIKV